MSVFIREDGVHFVLRTYREQLARSKRSFLKQRLRLLAEQHGEYVHISTSNTDPSYLNAVFSQEPGYLLGELVWQYFEQPSHLLYCERHPKDHTQIIIVAVVDHTIYLDSLLTDEEVAGELLTLLTIPHPFKVLIYGDVPIFIGKEKNIPIHENIPTLIGTIPEDDAFEYSNVSSSLNNIEGLTHFVLPNAQVENYEILEKSLLSELAPRSEYELQPLPRVLTSKLLAQTIHWPFVIIAIILIILLTIWFLYPTPPEQMATVNQPQILSQSPYAEFYQALGTPSVQASIENIVQIINNLNALPGWQTQNINYDGQQYSISLMRVGGDIRWLNNWAKQHNFNLTLTTNGGNLTTLSSLPGRAKPKQIYPMQQVISFVDEQLSEILDDNGLNVGEAEIRGQAKETPIILNLNAISTSFLLLIGRILGNDLPIRLDNVQLTEDNSNLLSGTIQFSVWGK